MCVYDLGKRKEAEVESVKSRWTTLLAPRVRVSQCDTVILRRVILHHQPPL